MLPMIFGHDEAFEQLRDEGIVYTVRSQEKPLDDVWIRRTRTGKKEFEGNRFLSFQIAGNGWSNESDEALKQWVDKSGFDSVEDWKEAIRSNNGEMPENAWIYAVQKKGEDYKPRFMDHDIRGQV